MSYWVLLAWFKRFNVIVYKKERLIVLDVFIMEEDGVWS